MLCLYVRDRSARDTGQFGGGIALRAQRKVVPTNQKTTGISETKFFFFYNFIQYYLEFYESVSVGIQYLKILHSVYKIVFIIADKYAFWTYSSTDLCNPEFK